jgi:hypothetical protein
VKKAGGGSSAGGFPTGPALTPKQKAERDRAEASKARGEAEKAREDARKAGAEARRDEGRAAADRKRHEYKFARQEMREARGDLAREGRDLARAARDQARARRDMGRARTAGLARAGAGGAWVLGGNDQYLTCAATAVANSLLLATGQRLSDDEVLSLHLAAAGSLDAEASVQGVLEAAQRFGLACGFDEGKADINPHALILELALAGGIHAVVLGDGFAVTWGQAVPVSTAFLDWQAVAAWRVTWSGMLR